MALRWSGGRAGWPGLPRSGGRAEPRSRGQTPFWGLAKRIRCFLFGGTFKTCLTPCPIRASETGIFCLREFTDGIRCAIIPSCMRWAAAWPRPRAAKSPTPSESARSRTPTCSTTLSEGGRPLGAFGACTATVPTNEALTLRSGTTRNASEWTASPGFTPKYTTQPVTPPSGQRRLDSPRSTPPNP